MSSLYVVGTPIGNLEDLSPRGLRALQECDFIAAEDTRVTLKILNRFGFKKPMVCYHKFNYKEQGPVIVNRILAGESCALVTDAGMPAISDPGEDLVRICRDENIPVVSVPGPCAFATALAISGMPAGRFTFEGFLSVNRSSRLQHLEALKNEERTMIFYEAPHKLPNTLRDFAKYFGNRPLAIVRELTKIHEEVIRTTCEEAYALYGDGNLKGEMVLILGGAPPALPETYTPEQAVAMAKEEIAAGHSPSDAAKLAAKKTGLRKGEIYKLLMQEDDV